MNTNQAIHMIQDHGHKAFATADGLLAMSREWACDWFEGAAQKAVAFVDADTIVEESTVFEVREDGTVDSEAIRRWLGY